MKKTLVAMALVLGGCTTQSTYVHSRHRESPAIRQTELKEANHPLFSRMDQWVYEGTHPGMVTQSEHNRGYTSLHFSYKRGDQAAAIDLIGQWGTGGSFHLQRVAIEEFTNKSVHDPDEKPLITNSHTTVYGGTSLGSAASSLSALAGKYRGNPGPLDPRIAALEEQLGSSMQRTTTEQRIAELRETLGYTGDHSYEERARELEAQLGSSMRIIDDPVRFREERIKELEDQIRREARQRRQE